MNKRMLKHDGATLEADSVALVANRDGSLDLLVPDGPEFELSRSQLFLTALAMRSTDAAWAEEQIEFIVEVRRQLDALDATQPRIRKDH